MTRKEAIKIFESWAQCSYAPTRDAAELALAALRGPNREMVERMRGYWKPVTESEITGFNPEYAGCDPIGNYVCSRCKTEAVLDCNGEFVLGNFFHACGAPMTGEAMDMVLKRWKEAVDGETD